MAEFEAAFSWNSDVVLPDQPSRTGRIRERFIGMMHGRVVTAVVSPLGAEALAVVSIHPAGSKERRAYDAQD